MLVMLIFLARSSTAAAIKLSEYVCKRNWAPTLTMLMLLAPTTHKDDED